MSRKRRKLLESANRGKTGGHDWSGSGYNRDHRIVRDQKAGDLKKERDISEELREISAQMAAATAASSEIN